MNNNYHLHNKPEREITDKDEIIRILKNGKYAVLSLCKDNEPYVVTLSYGCNEQADTLYFHCGKEGMKLNFIRANPVVCATVIEDNGYVPDVCTHRYRTVVLRGRIEILTNLEEMRQGMKILLNHLEDNSTVMNKVNDNLALYEKLAVLKLTITHIHGKARK
ncbi:putative flavin-nucleotide-binding protein [Bacteroidales bacterium Barb7]|nr:putative flavin-nucleotide-binding protein [Bacteroidales bacterium Barb7]